MYVFFSGQMDGDLILERHQPRRFNFISHISQKIIIMYDQNYILSFFYVCLQGRTKKLKIGGGGKTEGGKY